LGESDSLLGSWGFRPRHSLGVNSFVKLLLQAHPHFFKLLHLHLNFKFIPFKSSSRLEHPPHICHLEHLLSVPLQRIQLESVSPINLAGWSPIVLAHRVLEMLVGSRPLLEGGPWIVNEMGEYVGEGVPHL